MVIARGEITITELYDGDSFYRAWADTPDGSGSSFTTEESDRAYLGVYSGREEPIHHSQYKWSRIRGESAFTAILSNDSHQIGTDENGSNQNYTGAKTTVAVFHGGEDDTSNWKIDSIQVEPAGAVTGKIIDTYTYKVESMTEDEASIIFTLKHKDNQYSPLEKVFTLSKNKQGLPGKAGKDAISAVLTNESITFAADKDGVVQNYVGNTGSFLLMEGTTNQSADIKFSIVNQTNVSAAIDEDNGSYTIFSMEKGTSVTTGQVTFRATYKGTTIDKTVTIGKSIAGQTGAQGNPGAPGDKGDPGVPATSYWLTSSVDTITVKYSGDYDPKTITYYGHSKTGSNNTESYAGRFIVQTSIDGVNFTEAYRSSADIDEVDFSVPEDVLFIKAKFYQAGGTTYLLNEQTTPILHSADGVKQEIKRTQNTAWIQAGMRVGYSSFTQTNPNSVYICGLEYRDGYRDMVLVDKPAEIYIRESNETALIPKQALSVSGIPAGVTAYILWDNTKKSLYLAYFESIMTETGVYKKRWRSISGNTINLTDSHFAIGEVET